VRLESREGVLVRSQQVFHLLDGQKWNKHFDACSVLKLVLCSAQNLFDFGDRTREFLSKILHNDVPILVVAQ